MAENKQFRNALKKKFQIASRVLLEFLEFWVNENFMIILTFNSEIYEIFSSKLSWKCEIGKRIWIFIFDSVCQSIIAQLENYCQSWLTYFNDFRFKIWNKIRKKRLIDILNFIKKIPLLSPASNIFNICMERTLSKKNRNILLVFQISFNPNNSNQKSVKIPINFHNNSWQVGKLINYNSFSLFFVKYHLRLINSD